MDALVPDIVAEWALFLDVDGTLLEIAPTPDATTVPAGLKELLVSLQRRARGALALISGRSLAQIDALFAPLRLPAAGLHGLERRTAAGVRQDANTMHEIPQAARKYLAQVVGRYPRLLLEDKGATLALHYRMTGRQSFRRATLKQVDYSRDHARVARQLGVSFSDVVSFRSRERCQ